MSSLRMAFHPFKGIMLIVNKYAGMQKKGKWIENRTTLEKVENGIGSGNLGGKKYLMKVIKLIWWEKELKKWKMNWFPSLRGKNVKGG